MSALSLDDLRELASFDAMLSEEDVTKVEHMVPDRGFHHRLLLSTMVRSGEQLRNGFGSAEGLESINEVVEQLDCYIEWLKTTAEIATKAKLRILAVGAYVEALQKQRH